MKEKAKKCSIILFFSTLFVVALVRNRHFSFFLFIRRGSRSTFSMHSCSIAVELLLFSAIILFIPVFFFLIIIYLFIVFPATFFSLFSKSILPAPPILHIFSVRYVYFWCCCCILFLFFCIYISLSLCVCVPFFLYVFVHLYAPVRGALLSSCCSMLLLLPAALLDLCKSEYLFLCFMQHGFILYSVIFLISYEKLLFFPFLGLFVSCSLLFGLPFERTTI